jgi:hypothetical protein
MEKRTVDRKTCCPNTALQFECLSVRDSFSLMDCIGNLLFVLLLSLAIIPFQKKKKCFVQTCMEIIFVSHFEEDQNCSRAVIGIKERHFDIFYLVEHIHCQQKKRKKKLKNENK